MPGFFDKELIPGKNNDEPLVVDTDPRGKSNLEMYQIVNEEAARKEADKANWDAFAQENNFGAGLYFAKSIVKESGMIAGLEMMADFTQIADPTFDPKPFVDETWPQWRKDKVMGAVNKRHAAELVDRTKWEDLYRIEGQYHGGVGTALNIVAGIANPENFLLGAGEVATLTKLGLTGGKKILAGAAIGMISNAGQEAILVANDETRGKLGIATAAAFGAGFGALGGFLTPPKGLEDVHAIDKAIGSDLAGFWKKDLEAAAGDIPMPNAVRTMSPDAKVWSDAVEAGQAAVSETGSYVVMKGEQAFEYKSKQLAIAAQKLLNKNIEPTVEAVAKRAEIDLGLEAAELDKLVPRRKGGKLSSIGLEGRSSENPYTRYLHSLITEDASGTGGRNVMAPSVALKADMDSLRWRSNWFVDRHNLSKEWLRDQARNGGKKYAPWDNTGVGNFDEAVYRELGYRKHPHTRPTDYQPHEAIPKAADAFTRMDNKRISRLIDSGATGYEKAHTEAMHLRHKWDGISMTKVSKDFDENFVVNLIQKGIMNGKEFDKAAKYGHLGDKLTEAYKERTARNMAKAIYSRFTRRPDTVNMAKAGFLSKVDRLEFERRAADLINNEADLKHLLASIDSKDSRKVNELLSQIDMDVNMEINGVAIRNLMDTSLGSTIDTEIRQSAGRAAMADIGFKDRDTFLEYTEKAAEWSRKNTKMHEKELIRTNEHNQKLWQLALGENLENDPDAAVSRWARALRKSATLASLNQVGFAQMAETGRLASSITVRGMLKQIPEFRNMVRNMKTGKFKDAVLNDIEAAFDIRLGDENLIHHPSLRAESGGYKISKDGGGRFMAGLETIMDKALHVQGYINGMTMLMKAQHRAHARGFFYRMWKDVQGAEVPASRLRRYADLGLSVEDMKVVKSEMATKSKMGTGWFGQTRPTDFRLIEFAPEIRQKLGLALHKNQANVIQRTIAGEQAWYSETTLGKLLTQFRSFPLVAIEKQSLHDLKHLDIESFTALTGSLAFASLAYTAKTYANSFGLPANKRKQYLKNRLDPAKIAAGAVSWSGQANIIPEILQTAGDFGLVNPFMYTYQKGQSYKDYRQSGLTLGAIGPVGSQISKAYSLATGLGRAVLTPEEFSYRTFKDLPSLIPFGNALGIKNATNALLND